MSRNVCLSLVICTLLLLLSVHESGAEPGAEAPTATKVKVKQLLQARQDVLQRLYEGIKSKHGDGLVSHDRIVAALDDLLKAKLELAESKQERLEICKQRIDNYRFLEEIVDTRFKSGSAVLDDRLTATAARLQAEIDYAMEEMKPE